jgi:hypothetical protein
MGDASPGSFETSFVGLGVASSGLAMRKPPRALERLRSLLMAVAINDCAMMYGNYVLGRTGDRGLAAAAPDVRAVCLRNELIVANVKEQHMRPREHENL